MKEKNSSITVKKKRLIYSMLVAVCVLLLTAAIVLTVYFVTTGKNEVLEGPPANENPSGGDIVEPSNPSGGDEDEPSNPSGGDVNEPSNPGGDEGEPSDPSGGEIDEPSVPSGGDDTVKFVAPIANATCSVEYASIYTNVTMLGQIRKHMGVDFAAEKGTAVVAVADGTVASVSLDEVLGNVITIDHGDDLVSYYRFVEPVEGLTVGQKVVKGEKIAEVAEAYGTEKHDGEHLHFEMKVGTEWDDPAKYFDITYEEK